MAQYPFQPAILDALPEELAELFRGLEITLLEEICSRLKVSGELNEVTVQDIRALRSHGIDLEDIEKAIQNATGISEKKLNDLLDDVVARNQAYYTELIDLAAVTAPEKLVDVEDTRAIYEQTRQTMRNITQSMGFLVDHGRTMLKPAKAYQWALDNAEMQVQSGAISYNQAIASAVKQLADSGLCVVYDKAGNPIKNMVGYESGHKDQLDVAVRRAVMTGVNQLNSKYREQSMDYLETDLVEVSAHMGARNIDGPNGWENHEKWQGKVYRWRGHGSSHDKPEPKNHTAQEQETTPQQEPQAKIKNSIGIASEDVTAEYLQNATPGQGEITYDDGYEQDRHKAEVEFAQRLHDTFGGDIQLLQEVNQDKVHTADYQWNGKLWDLKTTSTEKAADAAIRHGLKQIYANPGGLILDYRGAEISFSELERIINSRMRHSTIKTVDVIIALSDGEIKVLRYKK